MQDVEYVSVTNRNPSDDGTAWRVSGVPASYSPHVLFGFGIHTCGRLVQQRDRGAPQHAQGEAQLGGRQTRGAVRHSAGAVPGAGLDTRARSDKRTLRLIPAGSFFTGFWRYSFRSRAFVILQKRWHEMSKPQYPEIQLIVQIVIPDAVFFPGTVKW